VDGPSQISISTILSGFCTFPPFLPFAVGPTKTKKIGVLLRMVTAPFFADDNVEGLICIWANTGNNFY
jgi:hypothetical protein